MRSGIQLFLLLSVIAVMAAACQDHRHEITTSPTSAPVRLI